LTSKKIDRGKIAATYFSKKRLVLISIVDRFLAFLYAFRRPNSIVIHDLEDNSIAEGKPAVKIKKRFDS